MNKVVWSNPDAYDMEDIKELPIRQFLTAFKEQNEVLSEEDILLDTEFLTYGELLRMVESKFAGEGHTMSANVNSHWSIPDIRNWEIRERCFACGKTIIVGQEVRDAKSRIRHKICWFRYCQWLKTKGYRIPANLDNRSKRSFVRKFAKVTTVEYIEIEPVIVWTLSKVRTYNEVFPKNKQPLSEEV